MIRDIIIFLLGIAAGSSYILTKTIRYDGILNVNRSNPEKDTFTMLFNIPLDDIPKRKMLMFKVEHIEDK